MGGRQLVGGLRAHARNGRERALLARLELTAVMRGAARIHSSDGAWWFRHPIGGLSSGFIEAGLLESGAWVDCAAAPAWAIGELRGDPGALIWAHALAADGEAQGSARRADCGDFLELRAMVEWRDLMPLGADYETTLAALGRHTRRNIRGARKAARAAGLSFAPLEAFPEEAFALAALNRPFAQRPSRLRRYEAYIVSAGTPFRSALRARDGALISYAAGFIEGDGAYLIYQLNHRDLGDLSLSLLHRAHMIERFANSGVSSLMFVHGCNGVLQHACEPLRIEEIWMFRPTLAARVRAGALLTLMPGAMMAPETRRGLRDFSRFNWPSREAVR